MAEEWNRVEPEVDRAWEESGIELQDIKTVETEEAQLAREGEAKRAEMDKLYEEKITLQKKVSSVLMIAVDAEGITPTDANLALDAFEKAYTDLPPNASAEQIKTTMQDLNTKYGDSMRALDTLLDGSSWRITNAFKKLAPDYKLKNQVALDQLKERVGQELKDNNLQQSTVDEIRKQADIAVDDIKKGVPGLEEKVEAKLGSKGGKIFLYILALAAVLGSLFLVAHFLQEKYEGCYLLITKGDSRKLNCGVDQDHCGCGDSDATRNLDSATDVICTKYGDYPFCKGSCRGNPTCSSIDKMVETNGKNYNWQSYTAFDALLTGLGDGVKSLSNDLGLDSVWKYIKYFVYGILGLMALIFVIWIVYEVWEHLPSKKEERSISD